jgi:septal ring-binding cell division protein DamX
MRQPVVLAHRLTARCRDGASPYLSTDPASDFPYAQAAATAEGQRLQHAEPWRQWGPYVSERSWGTVREDYSAAGSAVASPAARSRTQQSLSLGRRRDGRHLRSLPGLVFGLALWNERDPILKERMYGLVPDEGNHGEDVQGVLLLPRQPA